MSDTRRSRIRRILPYFLLGVVLLVVLCLLCCGLGTWFVWTRATREWAETAEVNEHYLESLVIVMGYPPAERDVLFARIEAHCDGIRNGTRSAPHSGRPDPALAPVAALLVVGGFEYAVLDHLAWDRAPLESAREDVHRYLGVALAAGASPVLASSIATEIVGANPLAVDVDHPLPPLDDAAVNAILAKMGTSAAHDGPAPDADQLDEALVSAVQLALWNARTSVSSGGGHHHHHH